MGDRFKIFNVKKKIIGNGGKIEIFNVQKRRYKMEMETDLKYEMCKKCINGNRGHI